MSNVVQSQSVSMSAQASVPARLAAAGTAIVAGFILALHLIKPEFQPSWRFLSEYAIGAHGWIMRVAFFVWAASCAALAVALRPEVRSRAGRAGVTVLLFVAPALVVAGLFAQDPVTIGPGEQTTAGGIHALASMVGIPGIPIAAMLISASLWRSNPRWRPHRAAIMTLAHATWISLLLMMVYLGWAVPRAGGFTPEVWAGWMNRLVVATYLAWQWGMARRVMDSDGAPR